MKGGIDRLFKQKRLAAASNLESKTAAATHNARRRLQGQFTTKLSVLQALCGNKAKRKDGLYYDKQ